MVKILVDFIVKLYQFPLLPYRWSKIPLRRNGNNDLTSKPELRRNGNKPTIHVRDLQLITCCLRYKGDKVK